MRQELPTLKSNGVSILHQYGPNSYSGCITLQDKRLGEIKECKY